jgi:hypothetical protein
VTRRREAKLSAQYFAIYRLAEIATVLFFKVASFRETELGSGASVSIVMIRCPYRGQAVSTGIEIDEATFARLPDTLILSRCPLCGLEHVWWKTEAWLEPTRYDNDRRSVGS